MRARIVLAWVVLGSCKQEPVGPPPAEPIRLGAAPAAAPPVPKRAPPPTAPAAPLLGFDGVVLGADGGPVAATLTVRRGTQAPVTFSTDGAGAFAAPELVEGEVTLEVRAPGQMPTKTAIYLPQHGYAVKLSAGHVLSLTARVQLHREEDGLDGPEDGPVLQSGAVDVWWQESEQMAWEKLSTAAISKGRATVRVPRGNIYLEVSAQGRCGPNFTTATKDAELSVALDGEETSGWLKPLAKTGEAWTVRAIPEAPSQSPCLVRSVAAPTDVTQGFSLPTTDFSHLFRVELVSPKQPVVAVSGKRTGGSSFFVKWSVDGASLEPALSATPTHDHHH